MCTESIVTTTAEGDADFDFSQTDLCEKDQHDFSQPVYRGDGTFVSADGGCWNCGKILGEEDDAIAPSLPMRAHTFSGRSVCGGSTVCDFCGYIQECQVCGVDLGTPHLPDCGNEYADHCDPLCSHCDAPMSMPAADSCKNPQHAPANAGKLLIEIPLRAGMTDAEIAEILEMIASDFRENVAGRDSFDGSDGWHDAKGVLLATMGSV